MPGTSEPLPSIFTSGLIIICTGFDAKRSIIVEQVSQGPSVFVNEGRESSTDSYIDIVVPNLLRAITVIAVSEDSFVNGIPIVSMLTGTYVSSPSEL